MFNQGRDDIASNVPVRGIADLSANIEVPAAQISGIWWFGKCIYDARPDR